MITKNIVNYVFGANTDVGKTIFTAGLCQAAIKNNKLVSYIKPIQTGCPIDSDEDFVKKQTSKTNLISKTIAQFSKPVSPHLAALSEEIYEIKNDSDVLYELNNLILSDNYQFMLIEGAGGVASPSINLSLQCDLYRKILLPVVFIADSKLGGISTSISSIELLQSRGFEISCVLLFSGEHQNANFLEKYFCNSIPVICFENIDNYFEDSNEKFNLNLWYKNQETNFLKAYDIISEKHNQKLLDIENAKLIAKKHVWWPFTQHKNLAEPNFIDSAYEDNISFYNNSESSVISNDYFDASASWWTQGIGHANITLAICASFAAARYGHVMFPKNIHIPAANLINKVLNTVGAGWADRVFFSDNGSTANEVAIKMAFRKSFGKKMNIKNPIILGLKDSYHGDTHAALDASSPNSFNCYDYWYNPRGLWLNYPKIVIQNSKYIVQLTKDLLQGQNLKSELNIETGFTNYNELLSSQRNNSNLYNIYNSYINSIFDQISMSNLNIGACLIEGIVMGSGGMIFVDPLFQKLLIVNCQERNIPVILDEVFTGFWRLGSVSASKILGIKPDIACYGKLLTGGLMPMSVTLATNDIFNSFIGDGLDDALLHGHSYTATPMGCEISAKAIDLIQRSKNFDNNTCEISNIWENKYIKEISHFNSVERVNYIGSLLAIELKEKSPGYMSVISKKIIEVLKQHFIESRPLGNVIYILSGFNTDLVKIESISKILNSILIDK
jgi:dethiobiotin synthetase/adenosylmethionine--8-amino-7-oxononanoate aminotransferase